MLDPCITVLYLSAIYTNYIYSPSSFPLLVLTLNMYEILLHRQLSLAFPRTE